MKRQFSWITTAICVLSLSVPGISLGAQHPKPPKAKVHAQKKGNNSSKQANKKHDQKKNAHKGDSRDEGLMRFQGLDKNRDGIITRSEWQGDDRAFANHDWDGNGFLSGDEVRPGATKPKTRGKK